MFGNYIINSANDSIVRVVNYNGNNLKISIDGNNSNTLPTSGIYYLVDYDCKSADTEIEWDKDNYELNVSNEGKKGGVSCFLEFKSSPLLSEMPVGSYVKYTGNNGCDGISCDGYNANYVSDDNMGYCHSDAFKFYVNGWRLGYVKDNSAHLISAGAPECMCTNSDNTINYDEGATNFTSTVRTAHLNNMDTVALKYCNKEYAKNGVCDISSAWAMDEYDFKEIFKRNLSTCNVQHSNVACGYNNDLIDNGSYYWYGSVYGSNNIYRWSPYNRYIYYHNTNILFGVRPVLAIDQSIAVIGGDGTYESPYIISGNYFKINGGKKYINASDDLSAVSLDISVFDSSVSSMCISVDTSECSSYVDFSSTYMLDFSGKSDGEKMVYVYLKNTSGDIVSIMNQSIIIDTIAPSNNIVIISNTLTPAKTLSLSSGGASYMGFSNFSPISDSCLSWEKYRTSYDWAFTSSFGTKTLYVFFKDEAGNVSMTTSTAVVNDYTYFIDGYNPSFIYVIRSDGATTLAKVAGGNSLLWYSEQSLDVNVCAADNSVSSSAYFWCITNDNKILENGL